MSKGGPLLITSKHHITKELRAVVPIWGYHWGHGRKSQHLHTPQNANGASRQAKHNQIDYKYVQVTKSRMLPRCLFWGIQWTQCRLKFWNIHVSIHVSLRSKQERRRSWKQQRNVILQKFLQHSDIDCTKSFVNSDTVLINKSIIQTCVMLRSWYTKQLQNHKSFCAVSDPFCPGLFLSRSFHVFSKLGAFIQKSQEVAWWIASVSHM